MMGSNLRTQPAAPKRAQSRQLNRVNLFVLIRVLFHYLEKVDARLLVQAKQVLKDCDKRKKDGDPEFQSLAGSIESRIRATVGDLHWNKAVTIQRQVLLNKQKQKVAAMQKKYNNMAKGTPSNSAAKAAEFRNSSLNCASPMLVKPENGEKPSAVKPPLTPGNASNPGRPNACFPPATISVTKPMPFVPVLDRSAFYSSAAAQASISPNIESMNAMREGRAASSVASSDDGSCD